MAKPPQKDIWSFGFQHWKDIWFPALAATAGCCSICPDSKSWLRGGNLFRSLERDQDRQEVDRVSTIASPSPSPIESPSPSPIKGPSPAIRGIMIGKRSSELPPWQASNLMAIKSYICSRSDYDALNEGCLRKHMKKQRKGQDEKAGSRHFSNSSFAKDQI